MAIWRDGKKSERKKRRRLQQRVKRMIANPLVFRFLIEVVWKLIDKLPE